VRESTGWRILRVERGFTETIMPLNVASTNQFVTHQAAMMLVAADYAGGVALSTLFHGTPILGFHPLRDDAAAYLWGAKSSSKWIRPSTEDLICRATVDPANWDRAFNRFKSGKRVLETAHIDMFNGDVLVAEADFTYWVADTRMLRASANDLSRIHPLQAHRLSSSAHLIAGLRALEHEAPPAGRAFDDPFAQVAARKQGLTLARRFALRTPELQPMIRARTRHLDDLVRQFECRRAPYQIVNVGAGFDFRRWRLPLAHCARYIEIDLPSLSAEKRSVLSSVNLDSRMVEQIQADLLQEGVDAALGRAGGFDPSLPTLCTWEGGSMYFDKGRCTAILRSIAAILKHPDSRVWFDYVNRDLIDRTPSIPRAVAFIDAMQKMGEPFVNGFDDIRDALPPHGLALEGDTGSGDGDVFELYRFCVARGLRRGASSLG
jgi:methyltransferase (TIGR00027 family)